MSSPLSLLLRIAVLLLEQEWSRLLKVILVHPKGGFSFRISVVSDGVVNTLLLLLHGLNRFHGTALRDPMCIVDRLKNRTSANLAHRLADWNWLQGSWLNLLFGRRLYPHWDGCSDLRTLARKHQDLLNKIVFIGRRKRFKRWWPNLLWGHISRRSY